MMKIMWNEYNKNKEVPSLCHFSLPLRFCIYQLNGKEVFIALVLSD